MKAEDILQHIISIVEKTTSKDVCENVDLSKIDHYSDYPQHIKNIERLLQKLNYFFCDGKLSNVHELWNNYKTLFAKD